MFLALDGTKLFKSFFQIIGSAVDPNVSSQSAVEHYPIQCIAKGPMAIEATFLLIMSHMPLSIWVRPLRTLYTSSLSHKYDLSLSYHPRSLSEDSSSIHPLHASFSLYSFSFLLSETCRWCLWRSFHLRSPSAKLSIRPIFHIWLFPHCSQIWGLDAVDLADVYVVFLNQTSDLIFTYFFHLGLTLYILLN